MVVKLRAILKMGLSNSVLSSPWDCQTLRYPHHGIVKLSANRNMWVSICTLSLIWGCQKQTFCTILIKGFLNFGFSNSTQYPTAGESSSTFFGQGCTLHIPYPTLLEKFRQISVYSVWLMMLLQSSMRRQIEGNGKKI